MKHYGDITEISGYDVPIVDIVTGGSPCQDLSVAGKREGLKGERSGLFMEQIRIIKEMREHDGKFQTDGTIRPRYMVWENVPGAFSSNKGYDFKAVLEETAKIANEAAVIPEPTKDKNGKLKWSPSGCIMGDGWSIAWRVHDAQFWGVPQRRKRIALVADFGGETAPEILFERKGVSGDTEESGEEGKDAAEDAERSVGEASKCLNSWDVQSKHIQPENGIAEALYSGECRGGGGESYVMQSISFQERAGKPGGGKGILIQNERTGALSTLNNQSVVYGISAYDSNAMKSDNPNSGIYEAGTTRALDSNGGNPACNQGGMVVLEGNGSRPSHKGDGYAESDTMYTLNSTEHHAVCVENHPTDSRVKISEDGMVQTLSSRMGTGGGNVPMVMDTYQKTTGALMASDYDKLGTQEAANDMYVVQSNWDGSQVAPTLTSNNAGGNQRMPDKDNFNAVLTYSLDRASFNQGMNAQYDFRVEEEKIGTQVAKGPGAACQSVVRRLTPLECERLQGFPDHWTDIGEWYDSKGKKHKDADSPRYKALGNSIALPFWEWMAERMMPCLPENPTMASLFSGIGGFELVFSRVGCKPVWASEVEEFPIAVTKRRFPDAETDS